MTTTASAPTSATQQQQKNEQQHWIIAAKEHLLDRTQRTELFALLMKQLRGDTKQTVAQLDTAIQSDPTDALSFALRGICLFLLR
jgi:tetratricopeptide (TPR) repeat protein